MKFSKPVSILKKLKEHYPVLPKSFLIHRNEFELLVATVLSAQCTDDRVNSVTPALFRAASNDSSLGAASLGATAQKMHELGESNIREFIKSVTFFNQKAKNIFALSKIISKEWNGRVSRVLEDLVSLPGVGRKTANVVLGNAFLVPGVVVDTHVMRLSNRFGWTRSKDPLVIEKDLELIFDSKEWIDLSHRLILHGRKFCTARKMKCNLCFLASICPSYRKADEEWK